MCAYRTGAAQELFTFCALHTRDVRDVELVLRPHIYYHSPSIIIQARPQRRWAQAIGIAQQTQLRRCCIVGLPACERCIVVGGQ